MRKVIFIILICWVAMPPRVSARDGSSAGSTPVYSICAVGDVMMGHRMSPFIDRHGPDYPFANVSETLVRADITIGNLEAPVGTEGVSDSTKTYSFLVPPKTLAGVKKAGFDVMCLANNHIMDFGDVALISTLDLLADAGILASGAGRDLSAARQPAIIDLNGRKIAFLSFSATLPTEFYATKTRPGTAQATPTHIQTDVEKASATADMVVVSFHWGQELRDNPKDYQKSLARLAIDSGAALVLGHHPHILQGVEVYNSGIIAYSLGNFAFGSYSPNAKTSMILNVYFDQNGLLGAEIIPVCVDNFQVHFQTRIESGQEARAILQEVQSLSEPFGTEIVVVESRGLIPLGVEHARLLDIIK